MPLFGQGFRGFSFCELSEWLNHSIYLRSALGTPALENRGLRGRFERRRDRRGRFLLLIKARAGVPLRAMCCKAANIGCERLARKKR
jgi:hypothetical protein